MRRRKMKNEVYKDITLCSNKKLDEKKIEYWNKIDKMIKKLQEDSFREEMNKNVDRIVLEYNKKGYIEVKGDIKPDEFMGRKIVDIEWIDNDRPKD